MTTTDPTPMADRRAAALTESWQLRRQHTTCPYGHPYDYTTPNGQRGCRTCRRQATARYRTRKPATPTADLPPEQLAARRQNAATRYHTRRAATINEQLPLEPLLTHLRRHLNINVVGCRTLAAHCHIPRHTALGWLRTRRIDPYEADRAAVTLGEHPATIWPDWWTRTEGDS
jgi:hypothetical protein